MKFLIAIFLVLSTFAKTTQLTDQQFIDYVDMTDAGLRIDLVGYCSRPNSCVNGIDVAYKDVFTLKIVVPSSYKSYFKVIAPGLTFCTHYHSCGQSDLLVNGIGILSNLPITKLTTPQNVRLENGKALYFANLYNLKPKKVNHVAIPMRTSISLIAEYEEIIVNSITLSSSMTTFKPFYDNAKLPLNNAIKMIKKETLTFQKHMSKSDRNLDHFERFIVSLEDAQSIIEDKRNYSVVDWRIQEGMRRVVSFGMIISDLLWAYEDVPGAAKNIENIRAFRDELKAIYGWEGTIAGNVSKTTSALLELVHYEINEIIKVKLALGDDDSFRVYKNITNEVRSLITKINSSDGGDIVVGQYVNKLMDLWNDSLWQIELKSLMEAKLDIRKLVRPKLKYILNAMMALEELIDNRRIYFEIDVIKPALDDKPTKG